MAYPFGGHPTLGQFMVWARDEHGFTCQSGTAPDRYGRQHPAVRIFKQGGPSAIVVGLSQSDFLMPTMIGYLERRLGVVSDWFSVDGN